jgi:hypothetical protein
MKSPTSIREDVISLVVLRLFAKRKKGMISEDDFQEFCNIGAMKALEIVTVRQKAKILEEIMNEEIRKAVELISKKTCGRCHGAGIQGKQGAQLVICPCLNMVNYRGDSVLPLGEQYSNEYFTGDQCKDELGRKNTVMNVATAVTLLLGG